MEFCDGLKEWLVRFLTGPSFLTATAVFLGYLVVFGIIRRTIRFVFGTIFGVFNPLRFRRVVINGVSLVFMTTSFTLFAGASAKLAGREGRLEAIMGGSLAVALWSLAMLVANLLRSPKPRSRKSVLTFRSKSGKVIPPTNMK